MRALEAPTLDEIRAARERLAGVTVRTPLVRLNADVPGEIWLKLENLQPIGSFKLRGAANAMRLAGPERLAKGAYTASAGNMAQGVAWSALQFGGPAAVCVPSTPRHKLAAIERLVGRVVKSLFDRWWQVLMDEYPGTAGRLHHLCADRAVMAGNGTSPWRLEDAGRRRRPSPSARRTLCGHRRGAGRAPSRPAGWGCEVATAAPLRRSLATARRSKHHPQSPLATASAQEHAAEIWPLAAASSPAPSRPSEDVAAAVASSPSATASSPKCRSHPRRRRLAAAEEGKKVVCIISGVNIDSAKLCAILDGRMP